ncbi:MAG: hypothetical protein QNJ72_23205 [Pleurocapsa sp. MO_226.B13]|nr:hypothetical protein [Pleurocapsa sp. MO_226.B13]
MPVKAKDGLRFILTLSNDLDDPFTSQTEWPRLSCPQANQLALEFGEFRIDDSLTVNGAIATKYYSSDGYVVIKLTTADTYYIGFSASAWFTNPTGNSFDISATVHHQANDL